MSEHALPPGRPRVAIFKFASCDGCQLSLLGCEDELLAVAGALDLVEFREMSSAVRPGPYDLALVEGSVTTSADARRIVEIRAASSILVTIGACATAGGIQGLRNFAANGSYASVVYARPDYLDSLATSTPIAAHVRVDYELHGCPVDRRQLLEVVLAFLAGRRPVIPGHSVCQECKARGVVCLAVTKAIECLGPVTRAGCGALCPAIGRGCFACFGPTQGANTASLAALFAASGTSEADLARLFRTFNANAPAFLAESRVHDSSRAE